MLSIEFTMVYGRVIKISFLTDISGSSISPTFGSFSPLTDPALLADPVPSRAALLSSHLFPSRVEVEAQPSSLSRHGRAPPPSILANWEHQSS